MSNVLKESPFFIPEKLVDGKPETQPGWKAVPIPDNQIKASEDAKEIEQTSPGSSSAQDVSEADVSQQQETDEVTDFTSPVEPSVQDPDSELNETDLPPELPDLEQIREQAYNQGLQDGLARAEEDFGSSVKALVMACQEVNGLRDTILNNSVEELQNLVLAIAEKIIRHSVTEQDRTIIDTVHEAIRRAVRSDEFIIRVNPADYTIINAKSKEFISSLSGLESIVVQTDPAIERGGCEIDSSTSMVDATITNQLQIIGQALKKKI